MRRLSCTAILILALAGSAAGVDGQDTPPYQIEAEILWQFDTDG